MEIEPVGKLAEIANHKRQLFLSPEAWGIGDRMILICSDTADMMSASEEDVRLNISNFPCIGIVKQNGEVSIDTHSAMQLGIYDKVSDLEADVDLLLEVNNLSRGSGRI